MKSKRGLVEDFVTDAVVEAERERTYDEAIGAWHTSCPKLPVWEDAVDRGLIVREDSGEKSTISITASGLALLERRPG